MQDSTSNIDWAQFHDAYGNARETGELIDQIAAGEDAWGELYNRVLHQGTLYEATVPVASWMIHGLVTSKIGDRVIPVGRPFGSDAAVSERILAFGLLSGMAESAKSALESGSRAYVCSGLPADKYASLGNRVLDALRQGIPLYEQAIADRQKEVRLAGAALLKAAAINRASAFTAIEKCYDREPESEIRVAYLSALNKLAEDERSWCDRLASILDRTGSGHQELSAREIFYAAAYLTLRLGQDTPPRFLNHLAELFPTLPESEPPYAEDLSNLENPAKIFWAAASALKQTGGVALLSETLRSCERIEGYFGPMRLIAIVERLLRLASGDHRTGWEGRTYQSRPRPNYSYTKITALSDPGEWTQSPCGVRALQAIAASERFWKIQTNLMSLFGLPMEQKALDEFLRRFKT